MLIYTEMEAAMRANDPDRYAALLADDFEYVRHKSQDTIDRDAMRGVHVSRKRRDERNPHVRKDDDDDNRAGSCGGDGRGDAVEGG